MEPRKCLLLDTTGKHITKHISTFESLINLHFCLFCHCVYACVHMLLHVCWVGVHIHCGMHIKIRGWPWVVLLYFVPCLRQGLFAIAYTRLAGLRTLGDSPSLPPISSQKPWDYRALHHCIQLVYVLGSELRSSGFHDKWFYPLSHLLTPQQMFHFKSLSKIENIQFSNVLFSM